MGMNEVTLQLACGRRMGKRDVAADLFIALMKAESPEQVHAVSTVVAVMLAKGCALLP